RANKSSSENFPHECHMFRPVKYSPHFGHFQSGFICLTADFADDADFCRLSDIRSLTSELFPLDRARWLARDVVADAVDAFDFVANARRNAGEQFIRKPRPIGGHSVLAFDDAKNDGVLVRALIAHHADRAHWQKYGERLPDAIVPVARFHLALHDGVGLA